MRVTNNMMIKSMVQNMNNSLRRMDQRMDELGTGKRIRVPSDDPLGLSVSMKLRSSLTELDRYRSNTESAISWLNGTDSALDEVNSTLLRVRDVAIYGATDMPQSARDALAAEVDQLHDHLIQIANTKHGHRHLFGGQHSAEEAYRLGPGVPEGILDPGETGITAVQTQNVPLGNYTLSVQDLDAPETLETAVVAEYQQADGAGSFLSDDINVTDGNTNASVVFELLDKADDGRLRFKITSYETSRTGEVSTHETTRLLEPGADTEVKVGNLELEVPLAADDDQFTSGDKFLVQVNAAGEENDHEVSLDNGDLLPHTWRLDAGAVDGKESELRTVMLNENNGRITLGQLELTIDELATGEASFYVQDNVVLGYQGGSGDQGDLKFEVGAGSVLTVNVPGDEVFDQALEAVAQIRDQLEAGDQEALSKTGIDLVDKAHDNVLKWRSEVGARANRMELSLHRLMELEVNYSRLQSEVEDVDIGKTIMDLKMDENVYRTSLAAGARVIQPTLMDFLR